MRLGGNIMRPHDLIRESDGNKNEIRDKRSGREHACTLRPFFIVVI